MNPFFICYFSGLKFQTALRKTAWAPSQQNMCTVIWKRRDGWLLL